MKSAPPRRHCCSFCGRDRSECDLLFRSKIGGDPALICDSCTEEHMAIVEANRRAPGIVAALIEVARAKHHRDWLDAHDAR